MSTMPIRLACTGCKGHACELGSVQQRAELYYDKPFWFCYDCIGCAVVTEETITELPLPLYKQPTAEEYIKDIRPFDILTEGTTAGSKS